MRALSKAVGPEKLVAMHGRPMDMASAMGKPHPGGEGEGEGVGEGVGG